MEEFDIIRAVYSSKLKEGEPTLDSLADQLGADRDEIVSLVDPMVSKGLLVLEEGRIGLTKIGRAILRVVMIGGAFEIIHPGHLYTIEQAKKLGNTLVVVVAADKTVLKNKGREPVTTLDWRVKLVAALRDVDVGMAGGQGSIYDTLERVRPDVVALGYDQLHNPAEIEAEAKRRGLELSVVRLSSPLPGVKTSKIVSAL